MCLAFFKSIGLMELGIILFLILLFVGARKIPELARGFGSGIKEFKKGLKEDEKPELPRR